MRKRSRGRQQMIWKHNSGACKQEKKEEAAVHLNPTDAASTQSWSSSSHWERRMQGSRSKCFKRSSAEDSKIWPALNRSSKRWISLQVKTTLTKPPKKRLTYTVAIGGFTQTWHTSIRYQQGTNLISKWRCRQCTASGKRRTRRNMQHGHKVPPLLLGNGMQIGGSPILSTRLKDGMTTDSTEQPVT